METLWQDLKYGARQLARAPGFTTVAVLTLALGIGSSTVIFSVVEAVLLRPLPYAEPDRIVRLEERHERFRTSNLTGATFLDVREQNRVFSHLAAYRFFSFNLTGEGPPENIVAARVTEGFFEVFAVRAASGRVFRSVDFLSGGDRVVILSHRLWQRRYGADPGLVGQTIDLDLEPYRVTGVAPPGFAFPAEADLWLPMSRERTLPQNRRSHLFTVLGRMSADVSPARARDELAALARRIEAQNANVDPGLALVITPLQERLVSSVRPALLALAGAVGFLLLIACANVANLLLAQGVARERELAIRASLGAGRLRLVRQLLTECALLGLAGGALGLVLAYWGADALLALGAGDIPRMSEVKLDARVWGFAAFLSLGTAFLFGLWPALQALRLELSPALKEGGRPASGLGSRRASSALVVAEIAIALVLFAGAGLLARSFLRLLDVNPGYNPRNVLTFYLTLPYQRYPTSADQLGFYQQVLDRLQAIPGVVAVGVSNFLPTRGLPTTTFELEGRPNIPGEWEPLADILAVSPEALRALEVPVRLGRNVTRADALGAPAVVLVNETFARRYWPDESPLGKRLTMLDWDEPLPAQVVGVVADLRVGELSEPPRPALFFSHAQFSDRVLGFYVVMRTKDDPLRSIPAVREQVWAIDPDQPVADLLSLDQILAASVAPQRFRLVLFGAFAAASIVLVLAGIYGVVSYAVGSRTREIGLRLALGARPAEIFRLILGNGLRLALGGAAVGLAGAVALTRVLASLLYDVTPTDPLTFAGAVVLVVVVAALASWVPARRATRVDPMTALRYE